MANEKPWYIGKSPVGRAFQHFSNSAYEKTVLDDKTKELIRLAVASVFRCVHCTEVHIQDALDAGASKQEVTEALLLSSLQAASTQLSWHKKFFEEKLSEKEETIQ